MIYRLMRKLTVSRRIFGGFLLLVILFAMTVPFVLKSHQLLVERVKQLTDVDTKADRLLLLGSKRIESSRVNLMRFLQNYIPSTQESLDDVIHATQLLAEAEKLLIGQELIVDLKQVIETLTNYQSLIRQIGILRVDGKDFELSRMGFIALKTGSDIGFRIETIVEKNEARIADENRIADSRLKTSFRLLLVYSAGALILSLILAFFVGRSITIPISELRESAESFQKGDDLILSVTGTDELSLLALTFKQMAANLNQNKITMQDRADALEKELSQRRRAETELQKYQTNLEELVKSRTSELQRQLKELGKTRKAMLNILEDLEVSRKEADATMQKINVMSQAVYDALVMIDDQGKVQFWNQGAEKLFGYPAEEAMGMDFHAMAVPPEQREKAHTGIAQFAATGQGVVFGATIETTAINRTGQIFPVEVNLSPFQVDKKWFAVGTVRDITERTQAEKELKERMEDLERFSRLTINREEKMIQLKEEINTLLEQTDKEKKYKIVT